MSLIRLIISINILVPLFEYFANSLAVVNYRKQYINLAPNSLNL